MRWHSQFNGIGIEPANLKRIFNPFEQAQRTVADDYGGLGLGLVIAKELVEDQGGQSTLKAEATTWERLSWSPLKQRHRFP